MSDTGEERKLPPSPKKLSDARKKGRAPHSVDFIAAASASAGVACLWSQAGAIEDKWRQALLISDKLQPLSFDVAVRQALGVLAQLALETVSPILGAVVAAAVLAGLLANRGMIFSLEPVKPKFENINPVEGLKRLFSMRSAIELVKTLFKGVVLGATFLLVIMAMWKNLVYLPVCGVSCVAFVFGAQAKLLMGVAAGIFLATGLLDLLIQRWLFMREMRMTETEAKREFKEQEGNPQLRHEYRRQRRESTNEPPLGMRRATLVLRGREVLVGLRYVRGENGAPILVCRGKGDALLRLLDEARELGVCVVDDDVLSRRLIRKAKLGQAIPSQYFQAVAKALYTAGLV